MIGKHADDTFIMVNYEEKVGIGAQKRGQSLIEGIIITDVADFGVEDVFDTASFFDFEIVERSGVDEADDFAAMVEYREMLKAGAV